MVLKVEVEAEAPKEVERMRTNSPRMVRLRSKYFASTSKKASRALRGKLACLGTDARTSIAQDSTFNDKLVKNRERKLPAINGNLLLA